VFTRAPRQVERALDLCAAHGWARPTVYQGLYNPLNRRVEAELLPLLALRGVRFVAFNALAAGEGHGYVRKRCARKCCGAFCRTKDFDVVLGRIA